MVARGFGFLKIICCVNSLVKRKSKDNENILGEVELAELPLEPDRMAQANPSMH
jgi:hypothetical protein